MLGLAAPSMAGLPGVDLQFVVDLLLHYFVASLRIGSFLIAAPLFGARWLPLQVRIVLALSITAVVAVQLPNIDTTVITSLIGVMMMLVEVGIGLTAGLVLTILFSAVMLSGEKIATAAGLGFAAQVDPQTGGQTPVVSQTLYLFLTVLFLSVDGHLVAIATLMESYDILPIGASVAPQVLIGAGVNAVRCRNNHHVADCHGFADDQHIHWHHHQICTAIESVFIRFSHFAACCVYPAVFLNRRFWQQYGSID